MQETAKLKPKRIFTIKRVWTQVHWVVTYMKSYQRSRCSSVYCRSVRLIYEQIKEFFEDTWSKAELSVGFMMMIKIISDSTLKVSCSVLESLIARRAEYWQLCNTSLTSSHRSNTGEWVLRSCWAPSVGIMFESGLVVLDLQESSAAEPLTRLCVGPILFLGTCPSPVLPTYRGSAMVTLTKQLTCSLCCFDSPWPELRWFQSLRESSQWECSSGV